ncbi:MAG: aspartate aminotransferase family protein [Calditrichaeota bacterium]|nr:aspartate aminotransferase family protein [Calditrichota bacterium]
MNWIQESEQYFLPVYRRLPLEVQYGQGVFLYDRQGKAYLDFFSGLGVNALGYQHPRVQKAIEQQLKRNLHLSNFFVQDVQIELARKLLQLAGYDRLFFTNSGTEAIEGILKIVKKWGKARQKDHIICFENAFHGRTLGALSITAQEKYQKSFTPLLPGVIQLPYNDPGALLRTVNGRTAAIFLEFIQGEGGIVPAEPEFIQAIQTVREQHDVLVVGDEIQAGIGRTGKFMAYQHFDMQPDLVASAKALGGGLPLGAFLVRASLADVLQRGEHGTTFGGSPLSCAAGLAVLQEIEEKNLLQHVQKTGAYLLNQLRNLQSEFPDRIKTVRGLGLMAAMEMHQDTFPLVLKGLEKGIVLNSTAGNVLRFLPPLIVEASHIDQGVDIIRDILKQL